MHPFRSTVERDACDWERVGVILKLHSGRNLTCALTTAHCCQAGSRIVHCFTYAAIYRYIYLTISRQFPFRENFLSLPRLDRFFFCLLSILFAGSAWWMANSSWINTGMFHFAKRNGNKLHIAEIIAQWISWARHLCQVFTHWDTDIGIGDVCCTLVNHANFSLVNATHSNECTQLLSKQIYSLTPCMINFSVYNCPEPGSSHKQQKNAWIRRTSLRVKFKSTAIPAIPAIKLQIVLASSVQAECSTHCCTAIRQALLYVNVFLLNDTLAPTQISPYEVIVCVCVYVFVV